MKSQALLREVDSN